MSDKEKLLKSIARSRLNLLRLDEVERRGRAAVRSPGLKGLLLFAIPVLPIMLFPVSQRLFLWWSELLLNTFFKETKQ